MTTDPTAVPSAPADQNLRDRIRRAICEAEGFAWDTDMLEPDEYGEVADAVLAVLPAPADGRRDVQTVLAETVAVYAADRLGVSVADVLDAAADASAAERASSRPAGWVQGREWKADLLHQQARELRAGDETQQAGEGDRG